MNFQELIDKLKDDIDGAIAQRTALVDQRPILEPIMQALCVKTGWHPSWDGSWLCLSATGKKEDLLRAATQLREFNYRPSKGNELPKEETDSWSGLFYLHGDVMLNPKIFLVFGSTVCRRVQVGTEMKEVPVYKVVCGEAEPRTGHEEPSPSGLAADGPGHEDIPI